MPELRTDPAIRRRVIVGIAVMMLGGFIPVAVMGVIELAIRNVSPMVAGPGFAFSSLALVGGFLYALLPMLYYRCPQCKSRIRRLTRRPTQAGVAVPSNLNRYCEQCDIEWQTGWQESAGGGE